MAIRIKQFMIFLLTAILKDSIGVLASAIAFFGFSAMIPLSLLVIYCTSIFFSHVQIEHVLNDVLKSYVPSIPNSTVYLKQNVTRLADLGPKVGIFSAIGLLWTAIGGFVSLQYLLDVVWRNTHRRSFINQFIMGFGMLGILISLTLLASFATSITPSMIEKVFKGSNINLCIVLLHQSLRILFPMLLFVTCYFCYRFLPSKTIKNSYIVIGAGFSTIAIYSTRKFFVWCTSHLGQYQLIYGSLSFIMLLALWIYIVSVILLLGAEVALTLHKLHGNEESPQR